jgi:hypothetical protein
MMASNLNVPFQLTTEDDDYVPDTLRAFLAEADVKLEEVISEEEDTLVKDTTVDPKHSSLQSPDISTKVEFMSPASDIDGPFDTALGSACRRNPAELYQTAAEAKEQALDDQPGVCPDHDDNCRCHFVPTVPIFNLEAAFDNSCDDQEENGNQQVIEESDSINKSKNEELLDGVLSEMLGDGNRQETNDVDGDISKALSGNGAVVEKKDSGGDLDHNDDSGNTSAFESGSIAAEEDFLPDSHDTDLSFDEIDNDDDDDFNSFLPNNRRTSTSLVNLSTRLFQNEKSNEKVTSRRKAETAEAASRRASKPQASPRRNFMRSKKSRADSSQSADKKKSKSRRFTLSFPRSPKAQRVRRPNLNQHSFENERDDIPLKIEWSSQNSTSSAVVDLKKKPQERFKPPRKDRKKKKMTIPKTPRLLSKEKRGERKYSSIGLQEEKIGDFSHVVSNVDWKKRGLTKPKGPLLLSKKKLGERRYSSVGLPEKKKPVDHPANIDWANKQPTIPKSPMLSFFIKKHKSIAINEQECKENEPAPYVFRAKPAPHFPEPTFVAKGKKQMKLPLTVPKPFHLVSNERASSPERRRKSSLHSEKRASVKTKEPTEFKARPVPDFSHPSLLQPKTSMRPLTVPKPFHLATDERASSPSLRRVRESMDGAREGIAGKAAVPTEFKARPVPDFSRPRLLQPKTSMRPLTVPKPFHLATDERASSPSLLRVRESMDGAREGIAGKAAASIKFKARTVPDFSRPSLLKPKPSMRPLTVPKPFRLAKEKRTISPRNRRESSSRVPTAFNIRRPKIQNFDGTDEIVFRAKPMPNFSRNPNSHRKNLVKRALTVPVPFRLVSDERANSPTRIPTRKHAARAGRSLTSTTDDAPSLPLPVNDCFYEIRVV